MQIKQDYVFIHMGVTLDFSH